MAVLDEIPGIKVTVEVDGETAIEYDNPASGRLSLTHDDFHLADPKRPLPYIVKYIEAIPGAPFQFRIERTRNFKFKASRVSFKAVVDGQSDHSLIGSSKENSRSYWTEVIRYLVSSKVDKNTQYYFKFKNLQVGDVDNLTPADIEKQAKKTKEWGTLLVKCFHSKKSYKSHSLRDEPVPVNTSISGARTVSEKVLKGKSVDALTEFDTKTVAMSQEFNVWPYLDTKRRPFAIFEFRYRTRNGLIEEGVIPRPPTPTPEETVRDMSEAELRRLAQELLTAERERAKATAIKEENGRRIKREHEPTSETEFQAKYKARRTDNGQLEVDLTGDD
ncbi:hypothetical protein V8F20_007840 [Naviculisporaceae sp. PSN 640]